MEEKYLKIQLYVNDCETKNRGTFVSEKFHIFLDNMSFCRRHHQRTDFYETDIIEREHGNLLERFSLKQIQDLVDARKDVVCSSCRTKFNKWVKECKTADETSVNV